MSILLLWNGDLEAKDCSKISLVYSGDDGTLSVNIKETPVGYVLEELSQQADIRVIVEDSAANAEIWAEFQDVPLEEGIRRLLKGQSYILTEVEKPRETESDTAPRTFEIRVLERRITQESLDEKTITSPKEVISVDQEQDLEALAQTVRDAADPKARAAALSDIADRDVERGITAATAAIHDADSEVRAVALAILEELEPGDADWEGALERVAEMALTDSDPELRMDALEMLASTSQKAALGPLKQATQDSEPEVSEFALELFEQLKEELQDQGALAGSSSNL